MILSGWEREGNEKCLSQACGATIPGPSLLASSAPVLGVALIAVSSSRRMRSVSVPRSDDRRQYEDLDFRVFVLPRAARPRVRSAVRMCVRLFLSHSCLPIAISVEMFSAQGSCVHPTLWLAKGLVPAERLCGRYAQNDD